MTGNVPEIACIEFDKFASPKPNGYRRTVSFNQSKQVTLTWKNVNVFVKKKKSIFDFHKKSVNVQQKQLLHDVSGEVCPGHLLAIMGASGAGKSTLLNILTRRNMRRLKASGEVHVNGQDVGDDIVALSAYVQQSDLFIGTLTVREHLVFQALLRMDKHLTYKQRITRVEEVIVELGLSKCADNKIGINGRIKGISGGEMKRLSFASEVLTNPALMFCDEPTSGLDSFMSQSVVEVLKQMAAGGRTILCTIHQPSSEVYELFDHLLLLAEGRVAYRGQASKALDFFQRSGYICPKNYNPADFLIHKLALYPGKETESKERIIDICNKFWKESQQIEEVTPGNTDYPVFTVPTKSTCRYKASWFSQFRTVFWRSWISLAREPILTKMRIMQITVTGFLFGFAYLQQELNQEGIMNINGALFAIIVTVSFQNQNAVMNVFCAELPVFLREHGNGMYRTIIYFSCKTLAETPLIILLTTIFATITYWMIGFTPTTTSFAIAWMVLVLTANTSTSFGYMVSCVCGSLNLAMTISMLLMITLMLFAGFYLNVASIPWYFLWLRYISWLSYANEALSINQWKDVANISCVRDSCASTGKVVLQDLNFKEENLIFDILMIVILMFTFRMMAFVALWIRGRLNA